MKVRPGDVIRFHYDYHDPVKDRIGLVTSTRDTLLEPILESSDRRNPDIQRSRYLCHCLMSDGTYRAFYHTGLTNVRKLGKIELAALSYLGIRFDADIIESEGFEVRKVGRGGFGIPYLRNVLSTLQNQR